MSDPAADTPRARPLPNWLLNSLLVILSLLVAAGLAEIVGRYVYPVRTITKVTDDDLLFAPLPKSKKVFHRDPANGTKTILVRFNDRGHRGPDSGDKRGLRLMVYGDSFIEAEYSAEEDTFAARLGKELGDHFGPGLQTINAGVAGYGPDQALKRIERDFAAMQPDWVLLSIYAGNDYGDLLRNKLFLLDDAGRLTENRPALDEAMVDQFRDAERKSRKPKINAIFYDLRQSLKYLLAEKQAGAAAAPAGEWGKWLAERAGEYEQLRQGDLKVHNLFNDGYDADIALQPDAPSARHKRQLMSAFLRIAKERLDRLGVRTVVVAVPSPIDACRDYDWVVDTKAYPGYDRRRATAHVAEAARAAGLPAIDLLDALGTADCNKHYFHHGDVHWSDAGQARAAAAVAAFLKGLPDAGK